MRYLSIILIYTCSMLPTAIFANESDEWGELLTPSMPYSTNWSHSIKSEGVNKKQSSVEDQLLRVEQEIIILKAEFAYQNSDQNELNNYIHQLNTMEILPRFKERVARLKFFLTQTREREIDTVIESHLTVTGIQPLKFPIRGGENFVIAVLLPLTGEYEQAGVPLLKGITDALNNMDFVGTLVVVDTALYSNAFEVWQLVKAYEPDFVFGPLRKTIANQWQSLSTGVSTFYFNEMNFLNGHERALSPSKVKGVEVLMRFVERKAYQNILVLTDNHLASEKLESAFYSLWQSSEHHGSYQHQYVDKTVGEAIEVASNIKYSKSRKSWFQSLINTDVVFKPRARQDLDMVIFFLSDHNAIQVAAILDFYGFNHIPRVWYPIQAPRNTFFKKNLSSLSGSYAVLPTYVQQNLSVISQEKNNIQDENNRFGLFYALGQVAGKIVNNSAISDGLELYIETEFGGVQSNSVGQFYLLPMMYWVNQHETEVLSKISLSE